MKKIRKSVFETNSSSSHVLHIDEETELMDISLVPREDGVIEITPSDDYGWEWEKYNTAREKIMYCIVDQGDNNNYMDMLKEVIKNQTGAKEVILHTDHDCYLDHESVGTSQRAFNSKSLLRNFIFNRKSAVFTGNDNGDPEPEFYCDKYTAPYKIRLVSLVELRDNLINSVVGEEKEVESVNEWMYTLNKPENDYNWSYDYIPFLKDFVGTSPWLRNYDSENKTIEITAGNDGSVIKYKVQVELNEEKNESIPI